MEDINTFMHLLKKYKYFSVVLMLSITIFIVCLFTYYYFENMTYQIYQESIHNQSDSIIVSEINGYTGRFPDIIQAGNHLIAAYYWNNSHAPYVLGDSLGTIQLKYGTTDGSKWDSTSLEFIGEEFLINNNLGLWKDNEQYYYSKDEAEKHNAVFCIEARDPNFAKMGEKIIFTFFTRLPWDSKLGGNTYFQYDEDYDYTYGRTYIMYSDNRGITWSKPVEIPCNYLDRGCAKRGNIAILDENKLLIPLYGYNHNLGNSFTTANVVAVLEDENWKFQEEYYIHQEEGIPEDGAFEAGVTEVSFTTLGNDVYALCRPNADILVSKDSGKTWEKIFFSGEGNLILHQPSLETISDSQQILASWAEPNKTGGRDIYLYLFNPSKDVPWNYKNKYRIYHNENAGDMGDPTSIFLANQNVLTVYYDVQKGIVGCTKTKLMKSI